MATTGRDGRPIAENIAEAVKLGEVPSAACRVPATRLELEHNDGEAKSSKIKILARSSKAIEHWFWGKVEHDLKGMFMSRNRVALDWNHDDNELVGYANHFPIDDEGLWAEGALTPYREQDKAAEIIHKSGAGVPYEASIDFGGDGIVVEELGVGASAEVNDHQFEGPGIIIRKWPLRGIAVTPHGADQHTKSELFRFCQDPEVVPVQFINKGAKKMGVTTLTGPVSLTPPNGESPAAIEAAATTAAATAKTDGGDGAGAEASAGSAGGKQFLEAFGPQGGVWFAEGKTFAQAQLLHTAALASENTELKRRLGARSLGEEAPLSASVAAVEVEQNGPESGKRYHAKEDDQGKTRFADHIRIAGRN